MCGGKKVAFKDSNEATAKNVCMYTNEEFHYFRWKSDEFESLMSFEAENKQNETLKQLSVAI